MMRLNGIYGVGLLALVLGGCSTAGVQEVKSASSAPSASESEVVTEAAVDNTVNPEAVYSVTERKVVSEGSSEHAAMPRPNRLANVSEHKMEEASEVAQAQSEVQDAGTGGKCETDADCLGQDKCLKGDSGEGHCVRQ